MTETVITVLAVGVLLSTAIVVTLAILASRRRREVDDSSVLKQYTVDTCVVGPGPACGDISMSEMIASTRMTRRRVESSVRRLKKVHLADRHVHLTSGEVRYCLTMIGRFKLAPQRGLNLRKFSHKR